MRTVRKTKLAPDSTLHDHVGEGDFLDCYSVDIGRGDVPLAEIAQRVFTDLPCWIAALLSARDIGVSPFGLKTTASLTKAGAIQPTVAVGEPINFLCVRSIAEDEIILGEDDRHLDFKIALRRDREDPGRISLATWVRTHNRLGDFYLRAISAFHVLIVNARLAALARHYAP